MATRKIEIVPYNPAWPQMFEEEAANIKQVLGENCIAIHHIGSTSVPGLAAKPIIDMIPVVLDIMKVDQATQSMQRLGYEAKGEFGMLFRRFFVKNQTSQGYHVHVFEQGNPEIERHLQFRDWMRTHEDDRNAYAILKQELALRHPHDRNAYCLGKEGFVTAIDANTGFKGLRIVEALTPREWEAVRILRNKNFFDKVPMDDPYTWTFDHKDHIHFVLYKGTHIIGYTHLQLWPEHRAALRIIAIDEHLRGQGLGGQFLVLCERWLKQKGFHVLQTQASPAAYPFYLKYGYTEMPFNDPDGHESDPQDTDMGRTLVEEAPTTQTL
jgi:GrpB-like predicted nucleotidyltransferase (UPF0157 family)/GNAT superfamily N-acetyltransferase